jgi:hypothetical protein
MRDRTAPLVGDPHARMIVPRENRGGFDFWEGFESGFLLNDPWLHGTRLPKPFRFQGYQSDVVCERAGDWLRARAIEQPWFCVVSPEPPHPPYSAPASGILLRDPNTLALDPNVPRGGDVEKTARIDLAGYYAHLEATDRAIGRMLNTLQREETIVVFTSVHGDMHGANGLFRKGWPHEESVRVPMLVRMPPSLDDSHGSHARQELVSLLDLARWTTHWAEGRDWIVPDFAAQQLSMPSVVALPLQCDRIWRGVRTRTRKLVVADETTKPPGARSEVWLYFDLERDPGEHTNLATDPGRQGEINGLEALIQTPPPSG